MPKTTESSNYVTQLHASTRMCKDEDVELRMLASLKRQQDEDECRAPALSASQIHQCDVSISLSSDDASAWTHISQVCAITPWYFPSVLVNSFVTNPVQQSDVLISRLSFCLKYFLWPWLTLTLANFHFKPQHMPPWSANASSSLHFFLHYKGLKR